MRWELTPQENNVEYCFDKLLRRDVRKMHPSFPPSLSQASTAEIEEYFFKEMLYK